MMTRLRVGRNHFLGVAMLAVTALTALSCRDGHGPTDAGDQTPVSIVIAGPTTALQVGNTHVMSAITYDANDKVVPSPAVTWTSTSTSVATVATVDNTGVLTAVGIGSTMVIARAGQLQGFASVAVAPPPVGLEVLPRGEFGDTIQLAPGQQLQLTGEKVDRTGGFLQPNDGSVGSWGSSRSDVATVNSSGLVTALVEGDAQIAFSLESLTANRLVRVKRTPGSVTVRFIGPYNSDVTIVANNGDPVVPLGSGDVHQQTMPAGTLVAAVDGQPPGQEFVGLLPANSGLTLVATPVLPQNTIVLVPMWDWTGPIPSDTVMVRVLIATPDGGNVYLTDPGAPIGVPSLLGCYLDGYIGFTDYNARAAKPFDIVFQTGKGTSGPERARFTITPPQGGTAVTYVFTGPATAAMKMLTLVDHP